MSISHKNRPADRLIFGQLGQDTRTFREFGAASNSKHHRIHLPTRAKILLNPASDPQHAREGIEFPLESFRPIGGARIRLQFYRQLLFNLIQTEDITIPAFETQEPAEFPSPNTSKTSLLRVVLVESPYVPETVLGSPPISHPVAVPGEPSSNRATNLDHRRVLEGVHAA